ncbi:protein-tyrosine phosphatase-like protein [Zychaea mexicana]|uniref:protein-tyrosine phosphatase-like protein n=1 Tax=Zychaea mexicana TaxID=64656 RepID=UPI0022FF369E|nr:protein-tyrosine phosphatase-like protein [Zychaea mexicana]KAI9497137.1 protein-tyrosine phosphatase-like protein [Zychaea mexicana]
MHEIAPRLFVGSQAAGYSIDLLKEHGITHILSLGDFDSTHDHIIYKNIRILDLAEENLLQYLDDTYDFIHSAYENNGKILVHCEAGMSRSVAVMMAYLMRTQNLAPKAALDIIKDERNFVQPNEGFMDQLELYQILQYKVDTNHAAYRRFLVASMAREQQDTGYIANLSLTPNPVPDSQSQLIVRCKKCRYVLVNKEHILDHQPGKGQQAFAYTKRNADLNITSAAVTPTAHHQQQQMLNPLLASLGAANNNCSSYFIEPMEWTAVLQDGHIEGRIDCPKCMAKLGQYNWSGAQCSCGRWITPAFMLHRKQVDEIKRRR